MSLIHMSAVSIWKYGFYQILVQSLKNVLENVLSASRTFCIAIYLVYQADKYKMFHQTSSTILLATLVLSTWLVGRVLLKTRVISLTDIECSFQGKLAKTNNFILWLSTDRSYVISLRSVNLLLTVRSKNGEIYLDYVQFSF